MTKSLDILLIEDNPADAVLLQETLRYSQTRIEWASSLTEGLWLGLSRRFDAVLLDLNLPDSSGIETISKAAAELANVPIIVLTGMEDEIISRKAISKGAQDYLVKGQADSSSILRTIRYAIGRRQAQEEIRRERDFVSTVLDTAGLLVLVLDSEGRIIRFNRSCEEITGYSFREVRLKKPWEFLLPAPDADLFARSFAESLAGSNSQEIESCWMTKDGRRRLIHWANTILKTANIGGDSLICAGIDITEKRDAENLLSEHMRNLERLSAAATRLLEPMPYHEIFRYTALQLEKIAGNAIILISEFDMIRNRIIIRTVSGPDHKLARLNAIMERDPVGLSFAFQEGAREVMLRGRLAPWRVDCTNSASGKWICSSA